MMRRVDIVCAESSGGTKPPGTSGGNDSLAEGCVKGTCAVSCSCTDIFLETDGFCACDAAQSFLGLGKGTQVLYSTSNKRSTLCDPDNTIHTNALPSFLVLESNTRAGPRNTLRFILEPFVLAIHLLLSASKDAVHSSSTHVFRDASPGSMSSRILLAARPRRNP